jgi:ABC-2 type transport system permease protein
MGQALAGEQARQYGLGLVSRASFPGSIYSGATRLIAFTVLPAGFVVLAPVAFVREPTPAHLAVAVASAIGYAGLAALVFGIGLRRYQRGETPTSSA